METIKLKTVIGGLFLFMLIILSCEKEHDELQESNFKENWE